MQYSISLGHIIDKFELEELHMPENGRKKQILRSDLHRPGLALAGFTDFFDNKRLLLMSRSEIAYLRQLEPELRKSRIDEMLSRRSPALILARGVIPLPELREACQSFGVPLLRSGESSTILTSKLFEYLSIQLAPRTTVHGVLMEVYGWGVLIMGESGIGKSETAIELIKRGHRLIADDAVEIRRVSSKSLVGQSPENIRHFIELRGIGIINARRIFGMGAVKLQEKIDMCINLEIWDATKVYDRMGMDSEYTEILGIKVPVMTIPVKPGRNLAIIIEVAAMNNRQKKMGYNAAYELLSALGMDASMMPHEEIKRDLDI